MGYTNLGLVNHAKKLLAMKTKYMWGGIARPITNYYIDSLAKQYPSQYPSSRIATLRKCVGTDYIGVDCVGLIKSYYWSGKDDGGTGSPKYSAKTDVNTEGMYAAAKVKGKISTLPEKQGIILLCRTHPHVGVYLGNGYVIESTLSSRGDGVVKTKLTDFKWEYWMECPYIDYVDSSEKPSTDSTEKFSEKSGKKRVCEGFTSYELKGIYKSKGQAAIRNAMSKDSDILERCIIGNYYPMDRYVEMNNGTKWYRHSGGEKHYSMKQDGYLLFEQAGTYQKYKVTANLNIRAMPTLKAPIYGVCKAEDIIYAFSTSPTKSDGYYWKKIIYKGKIAYCVTNYIKEI